MSGFFRHQATLNSPQIVSDLTFASEWELSLRADRQQTPPFCSSVRKGILLAAISAVPNVLHTATQQHTHISASVHAPVSQPLTWPFVADSRRVLHPFYATGAAQTERLECYRLDDGRPCAEHAECKTIVDAMQMPGIQIGVNQEVVGHGLTYARNDPLLSHHGWAELVPLSLAILHDANELLSTTPNILDESVLYNTDWTEQDMVQFNNTLIDESEITCEWGACGNRLKIKEIRAHLKRKHHVSDSMSSRCFWHECSFREPMTQLSTLTRHVRECHGSLYKYRPCPTCDERFTRGETLKKHLQKCSGRGKLPVVPRLTG